MKQSLVVGVLLLGGPAGRATISLMLEGGLG